MCAALLRLLGGRISLGFTALMLGVVGLGGCIQPIQRPRTAPVSALSQAEGATNRLLVLGADGNIFTVAPDGADRFDLTDDATGGRFYAQPTWSPKGGRIAWAEVDSTSGAVSGALLTAAANGRDRTRVELPFPPFFIDWSPSGQQLVYLSTWLDAGAQTIALHLVDVAGGGAEAKLLGTGQPFYLSWSPDGSQLLTHVAAGRVGLLTRDGEETVLSDEASLFATPQWSSDGQHLLYGIHTAARPQLVVANRSGEVEQVVTFFQDEVRTAFSLSPSGRWIAYTETDVPLAVNSFGPLFVFERETGQFEQLSTEPVIAFFWSPVGDRLLMMRAEFVDQQLWFRLAVWDGESTQELGRFIPSALFLNQVLPFADQYAQSMRFWAPDGSAFVYAGAGEDGRQGIWIQQLSVAKPALVSEGLLASWSPQ